MWTARRCARPGVVLFAVAALLAGCQTTPIASPSAAKPPQQKSAAFVAPTFDTALQRHKPLGKVAGRAGEPLAQTPNDTQQFAQAVQYAQDTDSYALLIWHDGALVHEQYFGGHHATLRSESASMHKSVMALTVAAAIDDGIIESVDQAAAHWLVEWTDPARQKIRIRDLLTMSSGLRTLSLAGGAQSERAQFFIDGAGARATALSLTSVAPPATQFQYANSSSQLLGLIIERATRQPYADYLAKRIWQPMGAQEAFVWFNETDSFPRTYTALMARPRDWLRVGLLLKNRGAADGRQIIDADLIDAMTAPSTANPGYGWQIWRGVDRVGKRYYNDERSGLAVAQSEPFATDDLVFLDGYGGQRVYVSAKHDLVIVRLGDARPEWDDAILPNRVIAALETKK